jgi:hypothetical protein
MDQSKKKRFKSTQVRRSQAKLSLKRVNERVLLSLLGSRQLALMVLNMARARRAILKVQFWPFYCC